MARLKLKPGKTHREVGEAIMKMAASVYRADPAVPFDPQPAYAFENEFLELFQEASVPVPMAYKQIPDLPIADGVTVLFHFDRTITQHGQRMRVVNIAIPDFDGKVTQRLERSATMGSGAMEFELDDLAAEAFGYIVIFGCAG